MFLPFILPTITTLRGELGQRRMSDQLAFMSRRGLKLHGLIPAPKLILKKKGPNNLKIFFPPPLQIIIV